MAGVTRRLTGRATVRDPDEEHRTATPLELFFDLVFVVAVSQASSALHHELVDGHALDGAAGFAAGFFGAWWAWMNFTWFASAHDSDDVAHRLLTFVQMAGALVFAAGVPAAVEDGRWGLCVAGYAVMRLGLVAGWLRVARDEPGERARAQRYAVAITALQVLWIGGVVVLSDEGFALLFPFLAVGELLAPMWAERAGERPEFHSEHIAERYGLFTIIVLGESILAATVGLQTSVAEGGLTASVVVVAVGGLVLAFAAWWLYFDHPGHLSPTPAQAFRWGYGHVVIFASLAGLGAGIHVAAEALLGEAPARVGALAVALPAAGFLLGLALVMVLTGARVGERRVWPKLVGAAVILTLGGLAPVVVTVTGAAIVLTALAAWMVASGAAPLPGATGPGAEGPPLGSAA